MNTYILSKKSKSFDLLILTLIYSLAYLAGYYICRKAGGTVFRFFLFDLTATLVTFIFSVLLKNSSVYDAYWSLTPLLMALDLFITNRAFSFWQLLFLTVFSLWAVRLTINWITVFTDFSYEDWRYRKFRDENPPVLWFFINLTGIHLVPTLVVFLGFLPLFEIVKKPGNIAVLPGILVMLFGIALEFFADRDMHKFLKTSTKKTVCRNGLWQYSRHPNYLGEISVWAGVFLCMLPCAPEKWYYIIGAVSVTVLFNTVSIPLMETRQLDRRPDYAAYRQSTSRLLLLPVKK